MGLVTESRIDELLREGLRHHGVSREVKDVELFATPEGILADVVLLDGSVLEEAREAVEGVEGELRKDGVALVATVRALWQVESVEKVEIANPRGAPSDVVGALFKGTLRSGARQQEVWVSVTPSAQSVLRPLITTDWALRDLVRAFLQHWLSVGGTGHWDPIREQKLELGERAARYLRWRPYEQLKFRVHLVFRTLDSARRFLQRFDLLKGRAPRDLNDVLDGLPGPGGAFAPGERLPTTNGELYEMLLDSEKDGWWQFYLKELSQAGEKWPELRQEFPKAFVE